MTEDELKELVQLLGPATGAISSLADQLGDPEMQGAGQDNSTEESQGRTHSTYHFLRLFFIAESRRRSKIYWCHS